MSSSLKSCVIFWSVYQMHTAPLSHLTVPFGVEKLRVSGSDFANEMPGCLPSSITSLKLSNARNIKPGDIPPSVTKLELVDYKQQLDINVLPPSLIKLKTVLTRHSVHILQELPSSVMVLEVTDTATPPSTSSETVTTPIQKLFDLSCHCGNVKFQAELEESLSKSGRCNCSSCFITRLWVHPIDNMSSFKLLTPEENVSQYLYGTKQCQHFFCKTCGTPTHIKGDYPGYGPYMYVSVPCLLGLTQEQFASLPFKYGDGANDDFMNTPKFTKHL
ncbi:hypothetical protein SAMD00019534_052410 [Acytostelium subglobosum LB1]|uniref:hypothetical protein n=1 Tax=Acytostelium subglobosum LB1 TaxID=1410327 RepID=UPI000644F032|nr:hypothetical protein SAMD00019534_052410 [Acytostelium subglobosum LB1]GAM22066.1 hypothetical protein SAMD00019534_052410 [Acytostelium subglobosum LB1]|eukprot:XP_012755166.1 hypothetical protein SAMD00019534_052410 [Acytostelium subglobosum LB1]